MKAHFVTGELVAQNFEIVREIGRGAMGIVFMAVDRSLEREVALKVMVPTADGEPSREHTERFSREARAVAKLRGAHVAHVYEVGSTEDGNPFIVMEYLNGESLDKVLARRKRLSVPHAAEHVLHACSGVSEAHARGIIHRDLKPANLFVHQGHNDQACLKVLDFGVAKLFFEGAQLTWANQILGTPLYMSPEQRSSSSKVDARSDIWSLGVILYQLVTGRVPFNGETPAKIGERILFGVPVEPSLLAPSVTRELSRVILRCLEKEPDRRYLDVGQLAWELAPFAGARGTALAVEVQQLLALEPVKSSPSRPTSLRVRQPLPEAGAFSRQDARPWPDVDFSEEDTLVQALLNRVLDGRPMTFLVGSALTSPVQGKRGVPDAEALIRLVRARYRGPALERCDRILQEAGHRRYQAIFSHMLATHGIREVNRLIRRAVLNARRVGGTEDAAAGDPAVCARAEADIEGWWLPDGVEALGRLLTDYPQSFGDNVLTTTFDPLVEIAIARAGGRCFRTVLYRDGGLPTGPVHECNVVYLQGYWWGDRLHAPHLLSQDRPKLADTLAGLLRGGTLVVIGSDALEDTLARTLVQVITHGSGEGNHEDDIDVLLPFASPDRGYIQRRYAWLLDAFSPLVTQGRVVFYNGVNVHNVFPTLCRKLAPRVSSEPPTQRAGTPMPVAQDAHPGATLVSVYEHAPETDRKPGGSTEH